MPGTYDIGVAQPDQLRFEFEFDPSTKNGTFDLLYGPEPSRDPRRLHAVDGPTARTTRRGLPALAGSRRVPGRVAGDLARGHDEQHGGRGPPGLRRLRHSGGHLPFRPAVGGWPGGLRRVHLRSRTACRTQSSMLGAMDDAGWKSEVWVSPWAIGALGDEAKAADYLAPNSSACARPHQSRRRRLVAGQARGCSSTGPRARTSTASSWTAVTSPTCRARPRTSMPTAAMAGRCTTTIHCSSRARCAR